VKSLVLSLVLFCQQLSSLIPRTLVLPEGQTFQAKSVLFLKIGERWINTHFLICKHVEDTKWNNVYEGVLFWALRSFNATPKET